MGQEDSNDSRGTRESTILGEGVPPLGRQADPHRRIGVQLALGNGCFSDRMGCRGSIPKQSHGNNVWTLGTNGNTSEQQLEGTEDHTTGPSLSDSTGFQSSPVLGQQDHSQLHPQGRRQISTPQSTGYGNMEGCNESEYQHDSRSYSGCGQHSGRRTQSTQILPSGLATEPGDLPTYYTTRTATDRSVRNSQQHPVSIVLQPVSGSKLRRSGRLQSTMEPTPARLRKPTVHSIVKSGGKSTQRTGTRTADSTSVENSPVVSGPFGDVPRNLSRAATTGRHVSPSVNTTRTTDSSPSMGMRIMEVQLWIDRNKGIPRAIAETSLSKIADRTWDSYQSHWSDFWTWCGQNDVDWTCASISEILEFLLKRSTEVSVQSVGNATTAIAFVYRQLHPTEWLPKKFPTSISSYIKALKRKKPAGPKYLEFPDLTPCFQLVAEWDQWSVSEEQCRSKALFLVRASLFARSACVECIFRERMTFNENRITLVMNGPKQDSTKQVIVQLERLATATQQQSRLCPVDSLMAYMSRFLWKRSVTKASDIEWKVPNLSGIFQGLSTNKNPTALSSKYLSKLVKEQIFIPAGIDTTLFSPDCIRGACATMALDSGMDQEQVMRIGRWSQLRIFLRHYFRGGDAKEIVKVYSNLINTTTSEESFSSSSFSSPFSPLICSYTSRRTFHE